ncbi:MAG: type II toxin-antitoxin system VapC family toxin [Candidatus Njordarchaeales archaeon]
MKKSSSKIYAFIDANLLIYLNCIKDEEDRAPYETLYYNVLKSFVVFTDMLVIDELLWVSKKKYRIPYNVTIDFIRNAVSPYVSILTIDFSILDTFLSVLSKYGLKPSDAIHVAAMKNNNVSIIISEDDDFDKVEGIRRIWLST